MLKKKELLENDEQAIYVSFDNLYLFNLDIRKFA